MIITKEAQEKIVVKYMEEDHTIDEWFGFIDGMNAAIKLIDKIYKQQKLKKTNIELLTEIGKKNNRR